MAYFTRLLLLLSSTDEQSWASLLLTTQNDLDELLWFHKDFLIRTHTSKLNVHAGIDELDTQKRLAYRFMSMRHFLRSQTHGKLCVFVCFLHVVWGADGIEPNDHLFKWRVLLTVDYFWFQPHLLSFQCSYCEYLVIVFVGERCKRQDRPDPPGDRAMSHHFLYLKSARFR